MRLYRAALDLGGDADPVPMGEAIGASGLEGGLVDIALANYARKGYGAVEAGEITADPDADPDADPEAAALAALVGGFVLDRLALGHVNEPPVAKLEDGPRRGLGFDSRLRGESVDRRCVRRARGVQHRDL